MDIRHSSSVQGADECAEIYNNISYYSDRDHPSDRENWHGYYPLREEKHIGCTMDRTIGGYQFDKLISAFMYDRLFSKIK